ncbi:hypothetical protein [Gryllotalpicola protaetiae]|uniref:Uncharacterized protein n=1 Tax=Gryllotalpicola protaetiae TaxID=2419771 RepID=A0A387BEV6_9MICO|nr:hypothetical protein [Gryllotalpicola protaetiae]AYG02515.1 hypothetical protein D7I44_02565 [Gryllotalpicola protaetiae]
MSVYFVDKFLYEIDRDPELLERYRTDPQGLVAEWENGQGMLLGIAHTVERTSWLRLTEAERAALETHDYVALFEMGAHFFLNLTIMIALYDEEYAGRLGPLSFQREMAANLAHWIGKDYPSVDV